MIPEGLRWLLGANDAALTKRQKEGVAEFKFSGNDIIDDIVKERKEWADIRWIICWTVKSGSITKGGEVLEVIEVGADEANYSAVTHHATLESAGTKVVNIIALSSFLKRLQSSVPPTSR